MYESAFHPESPAYELASVHSWEHTLFVSLRLKCHPKRFIWPICVIQSAYDDINMQPLLISHRFRAIFKASDVFRACLSAWLTCLCICLSKVRWLIYNLSYTRMIKHLTICCRDFSSLSWVCRTNKQPARKHLLLFKLG